MIGRGCCRCGNISLTCNMYAKWLDKTLGFIEITNQSSIIVKNGSNTDEANHPGLVPRRVNTPNVWDVPKVVKSKKQTSLDSFVAQNSIPAASSAKDAWNQWFTPVPELGLFCSLQSFEKEMIRRNRRKYSERLTLAGAFKQYSSYESFEASYSGHTQSYSAILKEVRRRKQLNSM